MNTGTFAEAYVELIPQEGDTPAFGTIYKVSITLHKEGMIQVTHYKNGEKREENKRTAFIPLKQIRFITTKGYADAK